MSLRPNVTHQPRRSRLPRRRRLHAMLARFLLDHLSAMHRLPMRLPPGRKVVKHDSFAPAPNLVVEVSHEQRPPNF